MTRRHRRPVLPSRLPRTWMLAFALLTRLGMAGNAAAATFTVDRVDGEPSATMCDDAVQNDCSLRGAVVAANALAEPSTITVPAIDEILTAVKYALTTCPPS